MADLSDVMNALADTASGALYPPGTAGPNCVAGMPVLVYPGWPDPSSLKIDLAAGKAHVSIFAPDGLEKNVTRYPREWVQDGDLAVITLTATVDANVVTLGGSPTAGQVISVLFGNNAYPYAPVAGDTLATVATALAGMIPNATASGAVLTLPTTTPPVTVRLGTTGSLTREVRRQERLFQLSVWAATPATRDAVAKVVDATLAGMDWLTLADDSAARLIYHSSRQIDADQLEGVYRRDLTFTVEYATVQQMTATTITQVGLTVTAADTTIINTMT